MRIRAFRARPAVERVVTIECLRCGTQRDVDSSNGGVAHAGECSRCGEVGWALPAELTDRDRQILHSRRRTDALQAACAGLS